MCRQHGFRGQPDVRISRIHQPVLFVEDSRVGSHVTRFEACSTFTRVTAFLLADPP